MASFFTRTVHKIGSVLRANFLFEGWRRAGSALSYKNCYAKTASYSLACQIFSL